MKTKAFPIAWKRLFDYNKLIHRMHPDCLQAGDAFYERSIIPEGDRNALKTGNAK